jgi:SAM-dependent methyltransferase
VTRARTANSARRRAEALADASTIVARRIPAPRGLPFYGLDHPPGILERALAELSDLGIFRVYSHVVDLTGGLGGPARWLARRNACRVTLVEENEEMAGAAAVLTERAFLVDRVRTVIARPAVLPFQGESFTHAWQVTTPLAERRDRRAIFAEAWRVLRPGGWLAIAASKALAGELEAAGFRDVRTTDLVPLLEDESTAAHLVAERVAASLGGGVDDRPRPHGSLLAIRAQKPT